MSAATGAAPEDEPRLPIRRESTLRGVLRTAGRIVPHLLAVTRQLKPTFHVRDLTRIDAGFLADHGIRAVIWDVDGTLMGHHAKSPSESVARRFRELLANPDLRHAIVSNCDEARLIELAEIFPTVPIVIGYAGDEGPVFRIQLGEEHRIVDWRGHPVEAVVPEWPLLRKPNGVLIEGARSAVGGPPKADTLLVGDQYYTDIASANEAGIRSAKVRTLEPRSFPLVNRVGQLVEAGVYRLLYGRHHEE